MSEVVHDEEGAMSTLPVLRSLVAAVEGKASIDELSTRLRPLARAAGDGEVGEALRGSWLGHALHPLLTDLPLGCWLAADLLDLVGGQQSRGAAQRLVGLGLLAVPPTVAAGLADWDRIGTEPVRRVATVHAVGNTAVAACYLLSWQARRRGRHGLGVAAGLVGGSLAMATGYLGGHLSFARAAGVEDRGVGLPRRSGAGETENADGSSAGARDGAESARVASPG
jgi:uncharacterized membrane protein